MIHLYYDCIQKKKKKDHQKSTNNYNTICNIIFLMEKMLTNNKGIKHHTLEIIIDDEILINKIIFL